MARYDDQITLEDTNPEYAAFVEKFKPKKTTDDCYTPENVFQAVVAWAAKEYSFDPARIVRPFWPGGDYERFDYPDGCIVLDNPPFSILAAIRKFYNGHGVKYFLFAPSLTCLGGGIDCAVVADTDITYENGANVRTSFVTNLEPDTLLRSAPDLHKAVEAANLVNVKAGKKELPKYSYPFHVVTAAMVQRYSKYGIPYRVKRGEALFIRALDAQRKEDKAVFGGGYLLAERAAAERAAAERAAAERAAAELANATVWELSDREKELVRQMGGPNE